MNHSKEYFNNNIADLGYLIQHIGWSWEEEDFTINKDIKEFEQFDGKKFIGAGVSTMVFENSNPDKVSCLCIDINKMRYLEETGMANYEFKKFIKFKHNNTEHYVGLYEVDKLYPLTKEAELEIVDKFDIPITAIVSDTTLDKFKKELLGLKVDIDLLNQINEDSEIGRITIDINKGGLMTNKEGEVLCFDPVCSLDTLLLFKKRFKGTLEEELKKNLKEYKKKGQDLIKDFKRKLPTNDKFVSSDFII